MRSSRRICDSYDFSLLMAALRSRNLDCILSVRVDTGVKRRLERLARSTGRTRSFLAAEAITEYLEINEWQVAGIKRAMASLDRGAGIPHESVRDWVASWGNANEKPMSKSS